MAIKELIRPKITHTIDPEVERFISEGGEPVGRKPREFKPRPPRPAKEKPHRMTLRIPHILIEKLDERMKKRISPMSRNLAILDILEKVLMG